MTKKQKKISETGKLPPEQQSDYFNELYDKAKMRSTAKNPASARPVPAVSQNKGTDYSNLIPLLKSAILSEWAETIIGKHFLAVTNNGAGIKIEIEDCSPFKPSRNSIVFGAYFQKTDQITICEEFFNDWKKANAYGNEDLILNKNQLTPSPVKNFARFIASTILHEAGHQDHGKWLKSKDLTYVYPQTEEMETHALAGLFLAEQLKKNPDYLNGTLTPGKALPVSVQIYRDRGHKLANDVSQNYEYLQRDVYSNYANRPSFELESARHFNKAKEILDELKKRGINDFNLTAKEKLEIDSALAAAPLPLLEDFTAPWSYESGFIRPLNTLTIAELKYYGAQYTRWHSEMSQRAEDFNKLTMRILSEINKENKEADQHKVPLPPGAGQ